MVRAHFIGGEDGFMPPIHAPLPFSTHACT
jgi:hypothetical protein